MIDIKSIVLGVYNKAKDALIALIGSNTPAVMEALNSYLENLKERTTELLAYVVDDSTEEGRKEKLAFVIGMLKDEKAILESEGLSFLIIGGQALQDAINSVTIILIDAIGSVIPNEN